MNAEKLINLFLSYADYLGLPDDDDLNKQIEFEEKFKALICEIKGHNVIRDQCGIPEHDFCAMCFKLKTDIEK